ncbi:MAG TPA: hypothetical protein VFN61_04515 [Acidimicrobiales bacterium]|nr:hypothetical protein [Acidimicrobiales bacterium]
MGTVASAALALLGIVVAINLANGTLGAWFKAKFLHQSPTSSTPAQAPKPGQVA